MKTNFIVPGRALITLLLILTTTHPGARAALVSVSSITNNADTIGVLFDPPVTLPSATNPASYTVLVNTGAISVASVSLETNGQFAALSLATTVGEFFSVGVSNVTDVVSNSINATVLGYLSDYFSDDVGLPGDPNPTGQVYTAHSDTFEVTAGGSDIGGTSDAFHFVYEAVIGDFDMAVLVKRLDEADPESKAGLMARETLAVDSATLQTFFTPTTGSNDVQVAVRSTAGGSTTDAGFQLGPRAAAAPLRWLRLTRSNDTFTAYHGIDVTNGVSWTVSGVTTQVFATNLFLGLAVASHTTDGTPTTAGFTDFRISGARPGDDLVPLLSTASTATNLTLSWLRTPRDYAVEASTNLTSWGLFLLPIIEVATNTSQRTMTVPFSLSRTRLFLRLRRVQRVIPDPPFLLSTGIILSPNNGLTSSSSANTLCCPSYTVVPAYAYALSSGQVIAAKGTPVTFTTADSDLTVDTVLQVRNATGIATSDNLGAGSYKSKVLETTIASSMTNVFSMIVAPKASPPAGYTSPGVIRITVTY